MSVDQEALLRVDEDLRKIAKEIELLHRRRRRLVTEKARIQNGSGPQNGFVDVKDIKPLVQELVDRIGQEQAAERSGVTVQTLWRIRNEQVKRVRKSTARLIILTLYQVRKEMRSTGIARAWNETVKRRAKLEDMLGY